jgi:hypothetical protein
MSPLDDIIVAETDAYAIFVSATSTSGSAIEFDGRVDETNSSYILPSGHADELTK